MRAPEAGKRDDDEQVGEGVERECNWIEPGRYLGSHTDSAEEVLLIVSGTMEATVGDEVGELSAGQAALIPAMVSHGVRTIGSETARCVGFFSSAKVASTFDQPLMPFGQKVVGTPPIEAAV